MKKFVHWANSAKAADFRILHPYNQLPECNALGPTTALLCFVLDTERAPQPSTSCPSSITSIRLFPVAMA